MSLGTKICAGLLLAMLVLAGLLAIQHYRDAAALTTANQAVADQKARADQLEAANAGNLKAIQSLRDDASEKAQLARDADARTATIQAKYDGLSHSYQELKNADQPTRDWASTALPAGVAGVFNSAIDAPGGGDANRVPAPAGDH